MNGFNILPNAELRWYSCSIGAMDKAYQHAEAQLQLALQLADRERITEAYAAMGAVCRYTGQLEQARAHLERALAFSSGDMLGTSDATSSSSSSFTQSGTWATLALTMWLLGFPDQACQMMELAFDSALKCGKPFELNIVLFFGSILYRHMRAADRVLSIGLRLVALGQQYEMRTASIDGMNSLGWVEAAQGKITVGIAKIRAPASTSIKR